VTKELPVSVFATIVVTTLLMFASRDAAQTPGQTCTVEITAPTAGATVSDAGEAIGTAKGIPPGAHLWIFCRRVGIALLWPQGGGPAAVTNGNGKWKAFVTYGLPRDAGAQFQVVAAVVDDTKNAELLNWVKKSDETGQYPGIIPPAFLPDCEVKSVVVTRR
jgi:hypothetical protein